MIRHVPGASQTTDDTDEHPRARHEARSLPGGVPHGPKHGDRPGAPSPLRRGLGGALLCLALSSGSTGAGETGNAPVSPWVQDFEIVWKTVREEFYDPGLHGLDWNEMKRRYAPLVTRARTPQEASAVINRMLGELGASHTTYYTDEDPEYYLMLDLFPASAHRAVRSAAARHSGYVGAGVFTTTLEEQVFIRAVVDGGPAAQAGAAVGDRIVSVEGGPWHPVRSFAGRAGKPTTIRVQRTSSSSSRVDLRVVPQRISPLEFFLIGQKKSAKVFRRGGHNIGYVHVWSYAGQRFQDLLVEQVTKGDVALADALVLDLRDGIGGASVDYLNLFNDRIPIGTSIGRDGETRVLDTQWRKPAVLLVNGFTRSGKEMLALGFKRYGYGPVIGERTAGAVLAAGGEPIGERGFLYLARADVRIDGVRLEGVGVEPDIVVPFSLPYAQGNDPQLERALEVAAKLAEERRPAIPAGPAMVP